VTPGRSHFLTEFSRSQLFAILLVALTLNGFANRMAAALTQSDQAVAGGLLGLNAVVLFACFAILRIAFDDEELVTPDRPDWWIAGIAVVAVLLPLKLLSALALPLLALTVFIRSAPGTSSHRISVVGLALSGAVFVGPTTMAFAGSELTRLETALIPLFTSLQTDGNVLFGESSGETFVVGGGCSSFANITLAFVAVTAFWQVFDLPHPLRMLGWCALASGAVVAINTLRLTLIGLYPESFDYLHNTGGAELFMWATELAVILIAVVGVWRASPR